MNEEKTKELFVALITEKGLPKVLEEIGFENEYLMQKDGGEPDLIHILCIRLREALVGERAWYSIIYEDAWREHALKEME